jgi:CHAT domain-containing protein
MRRQIDYHLARARSASSAVSPAARASIAASAEGIVRALRRMYAERDLGMMLGFHRRLRAPRASAKWKMTKAEALQQAALKLMKSPETSHPFYWAGFVLVGDGK